MPRPATVTELLAIVKEQSRVIALLTEQLARNSTSVPRIVLDREEVEPTVVYTSQLPERVQEIILNRSFGDPAAYEYMEALALDSLARGMDENSVVQMIATGEQ